MDFLRQLFRGALVLLFTLAGLGIAFMFLVAAVFSLGIMYLVYLFKGQQFSATQYWQQSRAKASRTRAQFSERFRQPSYSRRPHQDVSDVTVREIPKD